MTRAGVCRGANVVWDGGSHLERGSGGGGEQAKFAVDPWSSLKVCKWSELMRVQMQTHLSIQKEDACFCPARTKTKAFLLLSPPKWAQAGTPCTFESCGRLSVCHTVHSAWTLITSPLVLLENFDQDSHTSMAQKAMPDLPHTLHTRWPQRQTQTRC